MEIDDAEVKQQTASLGQNLPLLKIMPTIPIFGNNSLLLKLMPTIPIFERDLAVKKEKKIISLKF